MAKQMTKQEIGKTMEKFAESYAGHGLALIQVDNPASLLGVKAPELKSQKMAYLIVPGPQEGELADTDIERVAGGLGDKYEANCESLLAVGTSSMVVLNIG